MGVKNTDENDGFVVTQMLQLIFRARARTRRASRSRSTGSVLKSMPDVAQDIAAVGTYVRSLSRKAKAEMSQIPWSRVIEATEPYDDSRRAERLTQSWGEVRDFLDGLQSAPEPLYDRIGQRWPYPWRICPNGRVWKGSSAKAQCQWAPSGKDWLYTVEIQAIAERYFDGPIRPMPTPKALGFENGNKFDKLIGGWTSYWNIVFLGFEGSTNSPLLPIPGPLDPNLVKALIATESGFNTDPRHFSLRNEGTVRGLIQLTEKTVRILKDGRGELRNHYVSLTLDDRLDPNLSICAGIRWLFQKQKIASVVRLKRPATWIEAVAEYKSYLQRMLDGRDPNPDGMRDLRKYYADLQSR